MSEENTPASSAEQQPEVEINMDKLDSLIREKKAHENMAMAIVAGLISSVVCAGIWAGVTVATGYQIGWMAIGVGFAVGIAVRMMGKGMSNSFGIVGAGFALFGCLLGNLLSIVGFVSQNEGVAFMQLMNSLTPPVVVELFQVTFAPMDLLFYGLAIYGGYKTSFAVLDEDELAAVTEQTPADPA